MAGSLRKVWGGPSWVLHREQSQFQGIPEAAADSVPSLCRFARMQRISKEKNGTVSRNQSLGGGCTWPVREDLCVITAGSGFPCLYGCMC